MTFQPFSENFSVIVIWNVIFPGRRNILRCWRVTPAAPRVNDVSCVTGSNHESHFSWQAQFGEVGGWLLLLHTLYWTFHV